MSSEKTTKYHAEAYKSIANMYVKEKLSIPAACTKIGIRLSTYYNICKKLGLESVTKYKDARLNFISGESKNPNLEANNIDEHNSTD